MNEGELVATDLEYRQSPNVLIAAARDHGKQLAIVDSHTRKERFRVTFQKRADGQRTNESECPECTGLRGRVERLERMARELDERTWRLVPCR